MEYGIFRENRMMERRREDFEREREDFERRREELFRDFDGMDPSFEDSDPRGCGMGRFDEHNLCRHMLFGCCRNCCCGCGCGCGCTGTDNGIQPF